MIAFIIKTLDGKLILYSSHCFNFCINERKRVECGLRLKHYLIFEILPKQSESLGKA